MSGASERLQTYFETIEKNVVTCYAIANTAKAKGFDPEEQVDIKIARNMAERVEGLIGVVAPQLIGSGVTERIMELEKEYSPLDWRVALKIALEVAQKKFCKFRDKKEAMEVGIRTGFAYQTAGIVAAPLEGFIELKIKKTHGGKEYFAPCYAGPIRGAGGTAAAFSLLLTDYVRVHMGYATYDPSEHEINRYKTEIYDYHERVTNLQYLPSREELDFLLRHLPVQVDGDPTELKEVSNYKDTPRVETNKIRGGICLVLAEGLSQKAPKLWKRLENWGKEFGLEWDFLADFLQVQKKIKAKKVPTTEKKAERVSPNYTFIADIVAGRPVLTHPMAQGGFRLRYGRTRTSGFSAAAINPATMIILDHFIAIGTQLKVERPGKAAAITPCDRIHGPIVLLHDGTVRCIETIEEAKRDKELVQEILYMGDLLFNYGDFSENGHVLVPCGYNEDWWVQHLRQAMNKQKEVLSRERREYFVDPRQNKPFQECLLLSQKYNIPLHPQYIYFWSHLSQEQFQDILQSLSAARLLEDKVIIPFTALRKRALEILGIPHILVNKEFMVIEHDVAAAFCYSLGIQHYEDIEKIQRAFNPQKSILENMNIFSKVPIKEKAGTAIGARMGRPEKAKMRELTGSPQILFPVGTEGGRLRSFQAAINKKKITADFPIYFCPTCKKEKWISFCHTCKTKNIQQYYCNVCGQLFQDKCPLHGPAVPYKKIAFPIHELIQECLTYLGIPVLPELVKGIRGTSNEDHVVEYLGKGIIRAKHNVYVNKDGTIRYDMSELPITHFKPIEIGTSIEKLKQLGYEKDIENKSLESPTQICELLPQDILLPAATDAMDEPSDRVLVRVAQCIDEMLERIYKLPRFYNVQHKDDLIGQLTICLAPHISAGMVGRIIGFTQTQGFFAHPLFHAALRRDCFQYNTFIPIHDGKEWKNWKLGELVETLHPESIVDKYGTKEVKVKDYKTIGVDKQGNVVVVRINNFTKHSPIHMIQIKTKTGRNLTITENHKCLVKEGGIKVRRAKDLALGQKFILPKKVSLNAKKIKEISLIEVFRGRKDIVIKGVVKDLKREIKKSEKEMSVKTQIKYRDIRNFFYRDSIPLASLEKICIAYRVDIHRMTQKAKIAAKRDTVILPIKIAISEEFLEYLGLYVAEGYSRYVSVGKGCAQVYVSAFDKEIRKKIKKFGNKIGLKQSERKKDRITFSSRVWYELITKIFNCGSTAYKKRVPSFLFEADEKIMGAFLRGYFEGDGSVSLSDKRVACDSVSKELLQDIHLLLLKQGVFSRFYEYTKEPWPKLRKFYEKKGKIPKFTITKLTIPSNFVSLFHEKIGFITKRKKEILDSIAKRKGNGMKILQDEKYIYDEITEIKYLPSETSYCLNVENNVVLANGILTRQCDGDEASVTLLLDGLLNFSRRYLPARRGAKTMDAPLVLTSKLVPTEVDDQALGLDVVFEYPLELYEAAAEYKNPWDVPIEQIKNRVNTPAQYEQMGFTHDCTNINEGVTCSAYKELPSMEEKLQGQMRLATKIRAVDESDVARLVIERHLLKDIKGNLRKFSQQKFRCVSCNAKYRRPPLIGKCTACGGKIIFTISEGSVIKYLEPSISLGNAYNISPYLKQSLELLQCTIDAVFGKEKEKQEGLGKWFG